jgi:hypothetical protein
VVRVFVLRDGFRGESHVIVLNRLGNEHVSELRIGIVEPADRVIVCQILNSSDRGQDEYRDRGGLLHFEKGSQQSVETLEAFGSGAQRLLGHVAVHDEVGRSRLHPLGAGGPGNTERKHCRGARRGPQQNRLCHNPTPHEPDSWSRPGHRHIIQRPRMNSKL